VENKRYNSGIYVTCLCGLYLLVSDQISGKMLPKFLVLNYTQGQLMLPLTAKDNGLAVNSTAV